ncbi:MAG: glycosyltransferase [Acidimicrobiales bacterium]
MRILTLTSWYPPHHFGGYELSCHDVMVRLAERGHDVEVLCSDQRLTGVAGPATDHERHVHRRLRLYFAEGRPSSPGPAGRWVIERANQRALADLLARHRPEVVSVWHMGALSLGLLTTVTELGLPVVYAVCDDWLAYGAKLDAWVRLFDRTPWRRRIARAARPLLRVPTLVPDLPASGAFCFISHETRRRSERFSRWHDFPVASVVYSGVDRRLFHAPAGAVEKPWRGRLLYTGRFDRRKGLDTLIDALPRLPPETVLTADGRGGDAERDRLVARAAELGVADRVAFRQRNRVELPAAYADADAVVFPSEWDEPFGLVPVEAMACGTPVVATGRGGSAEFLRDGWNCVLYRPGDPEALAAAIDALRVDPDRRCRLVEGGLRTADVLDVDRLADLLEEWHVAAASGFADGRSADRVLDLPESARSAEHEDQPEGLDPLERHRAAAPDVLARGDADEIKRLYVDLGDDWWAAHGAAGDDIPVLSAAETHPVVVGCLEGVEGRILDAGCGPNPAVSITLAERPHRSVVSVDIGWGTVRVAREVAARRGASVLGVVADVEALPFRSRVFDGVACDDTIEHVPHDRVGVAELARVARPGGVVVLATPNRHNAKIVRARVRDLARGVRKPPADYFVSNSHLREYTWGEFERVVAPFLRLRRRVPVGWTPRGWKGRLADRAVRHGPLHRFSQMIVLEAEPR